LKNDLLLKKGWRKQMLMRNRRGILHPAISLFIMVLCFTVYRQPPLLAIKDKWWMLSLYGD
jgi:hypothetical protein